MFSLHVSPQPCVPGRPARQAHGQVSCAACGAPAGSAGEWLEEHRLGPTKAVLLCPLCHCCLHLDAAANLNAGTIIWMPRLDQASINLFALTAFVNVRHVRSLGDEASDDVVRYAKSLEELYRSLKAFDEPIKDALGEENPALSPGESSASIRHIAALIRHARETAGLSPSVLAQRLDGLRLLPALKPFSRYIAAVTPEVMRRAPIAAWGDLPTDRSASADA